MAFKDAKHVDSVFRGPVDDDVVGKPADPNALTEVWAKFTHQGLPSVEPQLFSQSIKEPVGGQWAVILDTDVIMDGIEIGDGLDVQIDWRH